MPISGKVYVWGDSARNVPERHGVYAFYNDAKHLIYIGKSVNLRETFIGYLETDFSNDPCKRETRYYKRESAESQAYMHDRMKELLDEYRQKHGALPNCNLPPEASKKAASSERTGFYFYEAIGKPLHIAAFSAQELRERIGEAPVGSLEFHQGRGDFARWIRNVFQNTRLARAIQEIEETGEDLRGELLKSLSSNEAACPRCGTETGPAKMWKMAGRPSKTGKRLQLTIGHFKCPKCNGTFRKVLTKERISS